MDYEIIGENMVNGCRRGDVQIYHSDVALEVGKLYMVLPGLRGGYRVLREIESKEEQA